MKTALHVFAATAFLLMQAVAGEKPPPAQRLGFTSETRLLIVNDGRRGDSSK
jgi:hypothetical protein